MFRSFINGITDISGYTELSNGVKMPYLGLGVFKSGNGNEIINAIHNAFDAGYRLIDTAAIYRNEEGVGEAIIRGKIDREDVFITSKVWNSDQGYDKTIRAFNESLKKLKTNYLDLYLIHWPVNAKFHETWKAMEELYNDGKIRAIGVSNFMKHHLIELMNTAHITPMVNQVEFHPLLVQQELLNFCYINRIQYQSWSPIMRGEVNNIDLLKKLAIKYQRTPVQIVLRWNLQKGVVTIPKSVRKERIISNSNIFDFQLSEPDMMQIDQLDQNKRRGPDPDNFEF